MNVEGITALEGVDSDINLGREFYDLQEVGLGTYFRDSIVADINSLRLYAGVHPKHLGCYLMLAKRFPYGIYYRIEDEIAIVVAVMPMRRDPEWIEKKLRRRVS